MAIPKIREVFLDMDGVLTDFESRYKEKFSLTTHEVRAMRDEKLYRENWATFVKDREFERLPMLEGAKELLTYLDSLKIPISILSSSGGDRFHEEVLLQKYVWLDNHNISYPRNIVPGRKKKKEYAHASALLIDDTPDVVTDFRLAGGHAVLWVGDNLLFSVKLYFNIWNSLNN